MTANLRPCHQHDMFDLTRAGRVLLYLMIANIVACAPQKPQYKAALTHQGKGNLLKPVDVIKMPAKAVRGGTLRRMIDKRPKHFNWLLVQTDHGQYFQEMVNEQLASQNKKHPNMWHQSLAKKITRSSDYKTFTISLRKGVYWQNPLHMKEGRQPKWIAKKHEVTAKDVKFMVDLIKNMDTKLSDWRVYYRELDRVEVVGRYTLKVHWKRKTFFAMEGTANLFPMPKWLYSRDENGSKIPSAKLGKAFNNHWASQYPVGTGPYKLERSSEDNIIMFTLNPTYWGKKPYIAKIKTYIQPKFLHGVRDFTHGALDYVVFNHDMRGWRRYFRTRDYNFRYRWFDDMSYFYLGWNQKNDLFKDKYVRQAMTLAFDRARAIKEIFKGSVYPHHGPYPNQHVANHPDIKPWPYHPGSAKILLARAGWRDADGDGVLERTIKGKTRRFEFTMIALKFSYVDKYLKMYQRTLKTLGIQMHIKIIKWDEYEERSKQKNFDAKVGGWPVNLDAEIFWIWHSSQAKAADGRNYISHIHKTADMLIEALKTTFSPSKRLQLFRAFHKHVHEFQPVTFFYAPKALLVHAERLHPVNIGVKHTRLSSRGWWIESKPIK